MAIIEKVRERVRKFFNPESFDAKSCRGMLLMGLMPLMLTEVMVIVLLQQSADLGELPHNITDALIIGISSVEVLLAPLLCWLGTQRRRTVMVGWALLSLITTLPLFALPKPETTPDAGLCSVTPRSFLSGIPTKAAVRLSLLIIAGVTCALGRTVFTGHGLAYIDEHAPSVNLHMHIGIVVMHRVFAYLVGSAAKYGFMEKPWIQLLVGSIQFMIMLIRIFSYPEVAPRVEKLSRRDRGLFRSMGRVLSNGLVVLQILSMALLTAAWWGFGIHEADFVQVKYNFRPEIDSSFGITTMILRLMPVILGVILAGFLYTVPLMPKYDRKAAVGNATHMCVGAALVFVMLTAALSCRHGGVTGAGVVGAGVEGTGVVYNQPTCGQNCSCDRPWMYYTPVCVPEQMKTYFSPCHAGCNSTEIVNSVSVYANCTCAPGGRATAGPCTDGACAGAYAFHQMLVVGLAVCCTLALVWQATVVLETVDKRDVAVAVGIMSSAVSLFAFVGAHGFYMGISSFTCAFTRGSKCLLQNSNFVPWVGYSSAALAGLAFVLGVITWIILRTQKEQMEEETDDEPL